MFLEAIGEWMPVKHAILPRSRSAHWSNAARFNSSFASSRARWTAAEGLI